MSVFQFPSGTPRMRENQVRSLAEVGTPWRSRGRMSYVSLTLGAVLMGLRIVLPRARGSDSNPIPGRLPRATFP